MNRSLTETLTESQTAGQLLMVGIQATGLSRELARAIARVSPGGIILFARNLEDATQVATLCRDLLSSVPVTPFLAIDQEGGRVSRLKGIFPAIPPNSALATGSQAETWIREHARQTALGLRLLGFNLNFAPVLDLSDPTMPNGIGDRAYGTDPERVAQLAGLFLDTMAGEGVQGCGKHFPGLGGGRVDSHLELPVIDLDAGELWDRDLSPYRRLGEKCPMVMVGHAFYPSLQEGPPTPATLSHQVVTGLLREKIEFQGICITDDMEMGAIDQQRNPGEITLEAVDAGHDMVMFCHSWDRIEEAHQTLLRAMKTGRISPARIQQSLARILSLKKTLPSPHRLPSFDLAKMKEVHSGFLSLEQTVDGKVDPLA